MKRAALTAFALVVACAVCGVWGAWGAKVDELFDLGRGTLDPAKRRRIYADLAKTMIEDATWVFLMQQVDVYGQRDRLAWTPRADQWMRFETVTLK